MADGTGFTPCWGFTPAQDLLEVMNTKSTTTTTTTPIKCLLVNPGDIRHVIKTVSRRRRRETKPKPIHFYLLEEKTEVLARHMMLLSILCDAKIPIRQRAHIFLEVYGNLLIQERTEKYVERVARDLIGVVCDDEGFLSKIVNLSALKYKVRDELETIFKSYSVKVPFEAETFHDHRQRGLLKARYDARDNIYDYDYEKGLVSSGCSIVHIKQYRRWRRDGIAFEFGDQTYTMPNRTLSSYAEGRARDGGAKLVRGFWGDVVNSPYISFGIYCETPNEFAKDLYKILNKGTGAAQHRHHTVEISIYNILSFLYEMENGRIYEMRKKHDIYSGLGVKDKDETEEDGVVIVEEEVEDEKEPDEERTRNIECAFDGVVVHLLSGTLEDVAKKSKFKNLFDFVSLSSKNAHYLAPTHHKNVLQRVVKENRGVIMCDTVRHMVPLHTKQKDTFQVKVTNLGKASGYSVTSPSSKEYLRFVPTSTSNKQSVVEEKIDTSDLDDIDS